MSLIPDYANAVGSAMSYNRKAADTKEKEKKNIKMAITARILEIAFIVALY